MKTVIDVGVGKGTDTLYSGVGHADYILVEPVPDTRGVVQKIADKLGGQFFNVAASDTDGETTFFLHEDITGSSLLKQLEKEEGLNGKEICVQTKRLDSIISSSLRTPCILKLDTQGHEINVLKGAANLLRQVDMIICEVSFHQFRQNAPEVADIIIKMREYDYVPYEILEGHYRSVDNALAQVDIVFVKTNSSLRDINTFFSDQQAKEYLKTGKLS